MVLPLLGKDGFFRSFLTRATPLKDSQGQIIQWFGTNTDIQEQKIEERDRAKKVRRQSEQRFRLLVEGVEDYVIFMLDPQGKVISWNKGAERIKGYHAEEIIDKHFSCFYTTEDQAQGKPRKEMETAIKIGRVEDEG
jgi:PAS domain-containing protein